MTRFSVLLLLVAPIACDTSPPPEAPPPEIAPAPAAFAHPDLLVETDWLAENVSGEDVVVVDVRSSEDYAAGHIPGAVSVPRDQTFDPNAEGGIVGPPDQISELFGGKGIDETVHVVVYDEGRSNKAARVFWTLEYYGHPRVSVLNGGIAKWQAESREFSTDVPETSPRTFTVTAREDRRTTKDEILIELANDQALLLDSRAPEEYVGEKLYSERGGRMPGAVNVEWARNFTDGEAPVFKSSADLAKMYADAGLVSDGTVHTYCQTAQRSSVSYLALRLLGYDTSNYDGSWQEWGNDPTTPIDLEK